MALSVGMPFNEGEEKMHRLLRVPGQDNPTSTMLTLQALSMSQRAPLLAFGTLDAQSRPWTTLWGVVQALVVDAEKGGIPDPKYGGKLVAGLAIDLMTRKRVKSAGRLIAGTVREVDVEVEGEPETKQDQIQLVTKIEQSLGNCPKYLNQYEIQPALVRSELEAEGPSLSDEGKTLGSKSDMFFLSTSTEDDMNVNHRGGPSEFLRIISSKKIVYPEHSGNRLYQSLGNLQLNPKIGITFPNYENGDVLYITGTTEILVGTDVATLLPGSNLAVKITIEETRFVAGGLPFRGVRKLPSPYNPLGRTLVSEGNIRSSLTSGRQTALALDFKQELDTGYEHMRDDDPTSLNDDFVRTFTISSSPNSTDGNEKEFEITIRKVGPVTKFLFQQNERAGFEVPILGVGGEFGIRQDAKGLTPFIAGGCGDNAAAGAVARFRFIAREDVGLAVDTLKRYPELAKCTEVFFTGDVEAWGVKYVTRRLTNNDFDGIEAERWYLCAGKLLREEIMSWLTGKTIVFEDFDY
ncbi:hypothetical protein EJ02DRAFT_506560 [Clathrospora elynae]|uniref:FAD-binding FR-type domain-containing protein n=1 Tax=Clathrospora elynae TaxID=706981 RepID=A0A6A5SA45_9PLEO|nr:hypothetical protein EJ02DRAFT_506560 [Clathrospora elynae]